MGFCTPHSACCSVNLFCMPFCMQNAKSRPHGDHVQCSMHKVDSNVMVMVFDVEVRLPHNMLLEAE